MHCALFRSALRRLDRGQRWIAAAVLCIAATTFLPVPARAAGPVQAQAREYADVGSQLRDEADLDAWYGGLRRLREDFDQICGDTFCEGDYSNIYGLRMECSAQRVSGLLGQCVWTFAASQEEVDAASGRVRVSPKVWRCKIPLAPRMALRELLRVLATQHPLHVELPGTGKSIYDGLIDCL